MDPATATLLAAGIGFSGSIIAAIISISDRKVEHSLRSDVTYTHKESVAIIRERVLDKDFLQNVIAQTSRHFVNLMDMQTSVLIEEMKIHQIKDSIHDVQAHVQSLSHLLTLNNMENSDLIMEVVITALYPLQTSIEKAKLQLKSYEQQDAALYCNIIGMTTLIASYAFLGQDMPLLRKSLDEAVKQVQLDILDEVAKRLVFSKDGFPWQEVPYLLTYQGINRLLELFHKTCNDDSSFPRSSFSY